MTMKGSCVIVKREAFILRRERFIVKA
jgi:uncharacterized membrane protein